MSIHKTPISAALVFASMAVPASLLAGPGLSGAPGDSSCAACHGASRTPLPSQTGGNGVFMTFSGGNTYTPGVDQNVTVTVVDAAFPAFGYQTSPRIQGHETSEGGGGLIPVDPDAQYYPPSGASTLTWIGAGESSTGASHNIFHFQWTPPATGTVVFYVIGMGANGSGGPAANEHVYANTYTLTQAGGVIKPVIAPGGVVSAAANVPGLTPGSWVAIYGQNLSKTTRSWRSADFAGAKLPESLDGVSVSIDNKPAAVYSIKPAQIDVQAPDDTALGPVQVTVTSSGVASDPVTVNLAKFAPSFFTFDGTHIAATDGANQPLTENSPARPGGVVVLYGTGFGPTSPPTPAGVIVSSANPLASRGLSISIGGLPARVLFAGVTATGLYQFNLRVPAALPDGDAKVVATIDSVHTQDGAVIPVRH